MTSGEPVAVPYKIIRYGEARSGEHYVQVYRDGVDGLVRPVVFGSTGETVCLKGPDILAVEPISKDAISAGAN